MSKLTNKIRHLDIQGVRSAVFGGADLRKCDARGNTALHIAAQMDAPPIAELLIDAGAPLQAKNRAGRTPADERPGTDTSKLIVHAALAMALPEKAAPRPRRRPNAI